MKVTVQVGGRFHAFNLAHELEIRGHLERLITSYPKKIVTSFGISEDKIQSVLRKEIVERFLRKLPASLRRSMNRQFFIHEIFDKKASELLPREMDLFVGWSSFSLHSLRKAKARGVKTIIDHGSSHIVIQTKILQEEEELWGVRFDGTHPGIIQKEVQEYKEADAIAIPSLYAKRTFLEEGVPEYKLIHIPYGVDLSSFRQVPKKDDKFRVIFVGGMTLQKGVHYLLQAFSELKLPNSELMLVGSMNDEMKPFFKKYEGSFRHVGHVPQGDLYKYYSEASVFALCSIQDGFGMVLLQAMSCGLPSIATENTGAMDVITEGKEGFIIPIRNIAALKEKILWMYENPEERARMGEAAKERVRSGFTWSDYGDKMVAAYQRLLND